MLVLAPARIVKLLTIGPRAVAHALLRPHHGSLLTAFVLLGLAALITGFARRRNTGPRA